MRVIMLILSFIFFTVPGATPGHAQNRVALVIGNSAYRNVTALPNPQNDATDIASSLQRLGFAVRLLHDATFDGMRRALLQFGRDAQGADMAVVYFAGHGMEIGGENWLIPVDAELRSDRDAENEAVSLKSAMLQVANAKSLGLVILDSCRDNPFAAQMQRVTRTRAVDRGLARVEPTDNVLVAYGAKDGTVASDGRGRNSPFTAALLNNLEKAGVEIRFLLASVRDEVLAATNRQQQPFVYGSLPRQEIYLKPPVKAENATASPSVQQQLTEAERAWAEVRAGQNLTALEAFVRRFPDSFYADLARVRIEELKKNTVARQTQEATPSVAPASNAPASLRDRLLAPLATLGVAANEADVVARAYEAEADSKTVAVAVNAHRTWRASGRSSKEAATASTLEGCQIQFGEPCMLVAAGDKVEISPAQDMPRVRYAGRFEPDRVPSADAGLMQRADVIAYRSVSTPKAAAYHPWGSGWLFIVAGAPNQFEAEERALARCNDDPRRKAERQFGPCFLYAAGNRVVLPQRLTKPRPKPQTISEAFDYLGLPGVATAYFGDKDHKAVAVAPERGLTFRVNGTASAAAAEQRALESCQLEFRIRCVLLASGDTLRAPDVWAADRHDMPRLGYKGTYVPEQVPLFSGTEEVLRSYASLSAPKAMAIRPNGSRARTATGASPVDAQSKALAACNDDRDATPCFVYAVNERVVLDQRRTEPLK
jgi:Caspase domain